MLDIYLGDSYDIVKRFWAEILDDVAPLYAHARFVPQDLHARFTALTRIKILNLEQLPETSFGLLLDPHTGIPLPDARSQKSSLAHASLGFIVELFSLENLSYIVCFDQTHDRSRSKTLKIDAQREMKRRHLLDQVVHSFYYLSHAPFLFMAKDKTILENVRAIIGKAGILEHTLARIRLQPILER